MKGVKTDYWTAKQMKVIFISFFAANLLYRIGLIFTHGRFGAGLVVITLAIVAVLVPLMWPF
jgi:hypothetical protein